MRDKGFLPSLDGKANIWNTLYRAQTLESIPEHAGEDSDEVTWPNAHDSLEKKDQEKDFTTVSTGINLPKLENKSIPQRVSTPCKLNHQGILSPKSSSFLSIANMRLSPREKATEKSKQESEIKNGNFLTYEPTVSDHVTADIDLSSYAFRAKLDRIPETDGERLLSAHGKRRSNSGDNKKQNSATTEKSSEEEKTSDTVSQLMNGKKKQKASLKSLDLFAQQRPQFARNYPPTRVAFSYKMIHGDLQSFMEQRNQGFQESSAKSLPLNAEDVVFPQIVLYQWEVHNQPKFIKAFRPRKQRKKLHRIPTGKTPQDSQSGVDEGEGKDEIDDTALRPDSSAYKLPNPPPPTPKCDSCKELNLIKSGSPKL